MTGLNERRIQLQAQVQSLTRDVAHWKHEAEQWRSLCRERLGPAGYKILEEVKQLRERVTDTDLLARYKLALEECTSFSCNCEYWRTECPQCIAGRALSEKVRNP